ncbi:MAG: RQC domain-containing protein [Ferruginibacter sp.]
MNASVSNSHRNIVKEAQILVKTVALLGEKYSMSYLSFILNGNTEFLKSEAHQQIETFGALPNWREHKLMRLADFLVEKGFLYVKEENYGTLGLGNQGISLLNSTQPLWIAGENLVIDDQDHFLMQGLKLLRKVWAEKEKQPTYYIFTDFMLYQLIKNKPENLEELRKITGFETTRAFKYGISILETMREVVEKLEELAEVEREEETKKAYYQSVKFFFELGLSVEGIAAQRKIKRATVCQYLIDLHESKEIDLTNWIERNIYPSMLDRAKHFFLQSPTADLNEAHISLGFDYDTLRFCRLYAKNVA